MRNEFPVYMDEVYDELKGQQPTLFEEIFRKYTNRSSETSIREFEHFNSLRTIKVSIKSTGETLIENAFICLSHQKRPPQFVKFYVSQEYNVNDSSDLPYVAGRFVFRYNESEELEVEALAEEPAKALLTGPTSTIATERLYLEKIKLHEPGK